MNGNDTTWLPLDEIVRLAEAAADEIEAADRGESVDPRMHVRAAALGLLLLAEIGAVGFDFGLDERDRPIPPSVSIGESEDVGGILADAERRISPYEVLLRRLGWERDRSYLHRSCDQLGVVYTR